MALCVRPLIDTGSAGLRFGAEVSGIGPLPLLQAELDEIVAAFEAHGVVVLDLGQKVDDEQHVALGEQLAAAMGSALEGSAPSQGHSGRPSMSVVTNMNEEGGILPASHPTLAAIVGAQFWHSDGSFRSVSSHASIVRCPVPVPPGNGGQTAFVSQRHAWNTLSPDLQQSSRKLTAVHDLAYSRALANPDLRGSEDIPAQLPPVTHPVVRETAAGPTLFLGAHASHLLSLEPQESRELICRLNNHICNVDKELVLTHEWREGDMIIYDNRSVLHRGCPFDGADHTPRKLVRVTVAGVEQASSLSTRDTTTQAAPAQAPLPAPDLAQRLRAAVGVSDLGEVDAERRYYGNFAEARTRL